MSNGPIVVASRGSALALAQTRQVIAEARKLFPSREFQIKVVKTTGDRLQTPDLARLAQTSSKGLFTRELEAELLAGSADIAVHSLKDLPTELPAGLVLGGVPPRADPRDVLVYRQNKGASGAIGLNGAGLADAGAMIRSLAAGSVIATSSLRRQCQILDLFGQLKVAPMRGNVPTRLRKLRSDPGLAGLVLAAAGLARLNITVQPDGQLRGEDVAGGLCAAFFSFHQMIPAVGQGALGLEIRAGDEELQRICHGLNDAGTRFCVEAERAFLKAMGGGCLSPVGAYAVIGENQMVLLRAISYSDGKTARTERSMPATEAIQIGNLAAADLRGG